MFPCGRENLPSLLLPVVGQEPLPRLCLPCPKLRVASSPRCQSAEVRQEQAERCRGDVWLKGRARSTWQRKARSRDASIPALQRQRLSRQPLLMCSNEDVHVPALYRRVCVFHQPSWHHLCRRAAASFLPLVFAFYFILLCFICSEFNAAEGSWNAASPNWGLLCLCV